MCFQILRSVGPTMQNRATHGLVGAADAWRILILTAFGGFYPNIIFVNQFLHTLHIIHIFFKTALASRSCRSHLRLVHKQQHDESGYPVVIVKTSRKWLETAKEKWSSSYDCWPRGSIDWWLWCWAAPKVRRIPSCAFSRATALARTESRCSGFRCLASCFRTIVGTLNFQYHDPCHV